MNDKSKDKPQPSIVTSTSTPPQTPDDKRDILTFSWDTQA